MSSHMERLKSKLRGETSVQMPKAEFEKEHEQLSRVLRSGTPAQRTAEAERQEAEARKARVRKGFGADRNSGS